MATIKDIAKEVGVSIGTVDRVLNDKGRYSADTAARVWDAVERLNYRPNVAARNLSQSRSLNVGVLIPNIEEGNGYWGLPFIGMEKAARELATQNTSLRAFHFKRFDPADFLRKGEEMCREEFNGLLISPLFPEESRRIMGSVKQNVPVVFFNTDLPDCGRLSFIGQDAHRSGMLAAKLMWYLTGKRAGPTLVIKADIHNKHLDDRVRGYVEKMRIKPKVGIYKAEDATNAPFHYEMLDQLLTEDIRGIFVTDASVYHAADYLVNRGLREHIALIGCDLTDSTRQRVASGSVDFVLTQRPVEMGYEGVYTLYRKVLLHESVDAEKIMPIDIITQENLKFFQW